VPLPAETLGPAGPAVQAEIGKLVFTSNRSEFRAQETGDIYVAQADGSSLTKLTQRPAIYEHPVWSPDGRQIAFASNHEGQRQIYAMQADGNAVMAEPGTALLDFINGWSPDGKWLLNESGRDVNGELCAVRPDGRQTVNLVWGSQGKHIELLAVATTTDDAGVTRFSDPLLAAARNAAYVSNCGDLLGTLETGKIADILVVNGNPLDDLQAPLDVQMVMRDSVIVRPAKEAIDVRTSGVRYAGSPDQPDGDGQSHP
jgi:hypothetical protein